MLTYIVFWQFIQTLIVLDLNTNRIGNEGARYLGDGLRYNKVRLLSIHFFSYAFVSLNADTDHAESPEKLYR